MRVTVNGSATDLPDGSSVDAVVRLLLPGSDGRGVAVARNGEVVPRPQWGSTPVGADDEVEVVTAFAGG
ncbi:sulfur carrier protein ThiS [Thalassiella azotivora]